MYLVVEVLILKLLPVDALTSSAILVGEVPSLDHETFDDCKKTTTHTQKKMQKDQLAWQSETVKLLLRMQ